jgi:hypothetical protein
MTGRLGELLTIRLGKSGSRRFSVGELLTLRLGELAIPPLAESRSRSGESGSRYSNFFLIYHRFTEL